MIKPSEAYVWISCWETDNGESFLDYFGDNINLDKFVLWLNYTGYMSDDKLKRYQKNCMSTSKAGYGIYLDGLLIGGEEFSLMDSDNEETSSLVYYKSIQIMADYICRTEKGAKALEEFCFEGKGWALANTDEDRKLLKESLNKVIDKWIYGEEDDYKNIKATSLESINKKSGFVKTMEIEGVLFTKDELQKCMKETTLHDVGGEEKLVNIEFEVSNNVKDCEVRKYYDKWEDIVSIFITVNNNVAEQMIKSKDSIEYLMTFLESRR